MKCGFCKWDEERGKTPTMKNNYRDETMSMHFISLTDYQEECVKQYKEYVEKKRGMKYTMSEILDVVITRAIADLEMDP